MIHKIKFTKKAEKDFILLENQIQKRIAKKIRFVTTLKDPLERAKKLKNCKYATYRYRVGDYRLLFDVDKKGNIHILLILRIKHRREAYD